MEESHKKPDSLTDTPKTLPLSLVITETNIINYLAQFESPIREIKAEEAMKVGVIAMLSANPHLDAKLVEEKFIDVQEKLAKFAEEFKANLAEDMKKYFEKEKGDLPTVLNDFFGAKGTLSESLKQYFDVKTGKLSLTLQSEIGPGSDFYKSLDPSNKESVVSKIEEIVRNQLAASVTGLSNEFSLDVDGSGMSRMKKVIEEKVSEVKKANDDFFAELREHFNIQKARAEEAAKGTQKGRDFETALYEPVAVLGKQLQDNTENVSGAIGSIERSKVGDYLITLGESSGSPGKKIVIEVKNEQGYRFKDAHQELQIAKENRKSDCGIFVFKKGLEPVEIGDFKIDGYDFFCTVDEKDLEEGKPLLFLESAYKIARIQLVLQSRKVAEVVDLEQVKSQIKLLLKQTELMSDIVTKAKTIKNNGDFIESTVKDIKDNLEKNIAFTLELLK